MKKKLLIVRVLGVAILLLAGVSVVLATPNTKIDIIQDCSAGCPEPLDMQGPTGFGFVNWNQDDTGALRLVVSLKNAEPHTTYQIFPHCGPTHATACGFVNSGSLTTNNQGNGNSGAVIVPLSVLQAPPFGSGTSQTGHIDFLISVGDTSAGVYVISGLNYDIP